MLWVDSQPQERAEAIIVAQLPCIHGQLAI
jgi:hypothetical protein